MKRKTFELASEVMAAGGNVSAALRARGEDPTEIVAYAYDLQAGSYTAALESYPTLRHRQLVGDKLAGILDELGASSACEAGVGEATTLQFVAEWCPEIAFSGFDVSVSRLLYGQRLLRERGRRAYLFAADLARIPLADASVDIVYTHHSLEPNGGREGPLLDELLRVAARHLVLVEPDYDLGDPEQRRRMAEHGYVRGLAEVLAGKPGRLIRREPWGIDANPANRASLIVFEKEPPGAARWRLVSPVSGRRLLSGDGYLYCPVDGFAYPVLHGIPCLLEDCAVLASHLGRFTSGRARQDPPRRR